MAALLIVLDFAGIFCFGSSLLIECKIEVGVLMIDRRMHATIEVARFCV